MGENIDLADGLDLDTEAGLTTFVERNRSFQMKSLPGGFNWSAAMSNIVLANAKLARLRSAPPPNPLRASKDNG